MGKGAGWIVAIGGRLSEALLATAVLVVAVMLGMAIYVALFDPVGEIWTFVTGFVVLVAAVAGVMHMVRNHHRVRKNLLLLLLVLLIVFVGLVVGLAIASPSKYHNAVGHISFGIGYTSAMLRIYFARDPAWVS